MQLWYHKLLVLLMTLVVVGYSRPPTDYYHQAPARWLRLEKMSFLRQGKPRVESKLVFQMEENQGRQQPEMVNQGRRRPEMVNLVMVEGQGIRRLEMANLVMVE